MRVLLATIAATASAMYDVLLPVPARATAPSICPHGCANWSNLEADGNTRDQAAVDAKFRHGVAPPTRDCAIPAYDVGESNPGWCYCRGTNDESWDYCLDAAGSVPEQINLQIVDLDAGAITVAFVTVDGNARGGPPVCQLGTSPGALANVTGTTNFWTQVGSARQYSFHFVPLTGLAPATTYFYRVSSGVAGAVWSNVYSFTTRDLDAPLTFAIFGDMGPYPVNNMDLLANASISAASPSSSQIAFVHHMGDHAYQMSSDDGRRGDLYMIAFEGVLTRTPWLATMGSAFVHGGVRLNCSFTHPHSPSRTDHEEYNGAFFMRYLNQTAGMAAPTPRSDSSVGGSTPGGGRWYSLNVGLLHHVVLDFNVYYSSEPDSLRVAQVRYV